MYNNKVLLLLISILLPNYIKAQAIDENVRERLEDFFKNYSSTSVNIGHCKLDSFALDHHNKEILIYADRRFSFQPFRETTVQGIYRNIQQILPGPVNYYTPHIFVQGKTIEELIPNFYRSKQLDPYRITEAIKDYAAPWVRNISKPYKIDRGLNNTHLSLWQSHGKYFADQKEEWLWQRPYLFCTTEDLFTQSFIIPFLIPMLENAGAIVFTPRERDIQKHEVIVDGDTPTGSIYIQDDKRRQRWKNRASIGFADRQESYEQGENPFKMGSSNIVKTRNKKAKSFAQWVPTIPQAGRYAVYVTYQSFKNSATDAQYLVYHKGGITEFKVNQKIGGGTWTYLGTFNFDSGNNINNMVILTNYSKDKGSVVSADAVRFGGGMGNISREGVVSGYPRYLEGARYSSQWYGMDEDIYTNKSRVNDYADDINARSNTLNYLTGGSVVNPRNEGLGVPFQLNVALHSDAGYSINDKIIGTLGIHTYQANQTFLGSGKDRISSRDLADLILTDLKKDIQSNFDIDWTRRSIWDSNYSETRLPDIPAVIIELLSHQNFKDMQLGHDPYFKFTASRSIYKSILKYLSNQAQKDYVVQPLPIRHFSTELRGNKAILSWQDTPDPLEPTAVAKEYIIYTKVGDAAFDNGTITSKKNVAIEITPGEIYSFKITAANQGGESFPSETLSVYKAPDEQKRVLIINGFTRLSGPYVVNNEFEAGFDINEDPGVPYLYDISLAGKQQNFRRADVDNKKGYPLGYSLNNLEGIIAAGNTFNYPYIHGEAIKVLPNISFASTSMKSVASGNVNIEQYHALDIILGLQTKANYNPSNNKHFELLPDQVQAMLSSYAQKGGAILISGSYIGSNLNTPTEKAFINNILSIEAKGFIKNKNITGVSGLQQNITIPREVNEKRYAVSKPEILAPINNAFTPLIYNNGESAAVAQHGRLKTFTLGFPFESIKEKKERFAIMSSILYFLLFED